MTGNDPAALLALLQQADSFFPSGQVAFSSGLEGLKADGLVAQPRQVLAFARALLRHRWASCERVVLTESHGAQGDLARVAQADHELETVQLAALARDGSHRAGRALLSVHASLGTPGAADYRVRVQEGAAPGHQAAVQGLLWRALELDLAACEAAAAHGFVVALLGAALRLSLVGHLDAQRILSALRADIATLLREPAPPLSSLIAYSPAAEIAMMRHEMRAGRLFAT
jgi:urease accessory protein